MPKSTDLYKDAAKSIQDAQAIQEKADAEGRSLTEEEAKKIDTLLADGDRLGKEADRRKLLEASVSRLREPQPAITDPRNSGYESLPAEPRDHKEEGKYGFKHVGEFAMAVRNALTPSIRKNDQRLEVLAAASGMRQSAGVDGGFLVPPTFSTAIWDGMSQMSDNLLARCDQYTVEGESLTFPANAEVARAAGSRYGGILGYWIAEADQVTASKPTFRQVKIEPQQLAVLVYVTDKLLNNSPVAIEQYITKAATEEINFLVSDAIINGNGVGQPLGIMNSPCLVSVAKETSQLAVTIREANLTKMRSRMLPRSFQQAVWFINQDVFPQLDALFQPVTNIGGTDNVGGYFSPVYNRDAQTILGRPVIPIESCATLGTKGDIILADMKGYLAGIRGGIASAMSLHLRFDFLESVFRFVFEVDGRPWLASSIVPFKSANSLSTFVTLDARG